MIIRCKGSSFSLLICRWFEKAPIARLEMGVIETFLFKYQCRAWIRIHFAFINSKSVSPLGKMLIWINYCCIMNLLIIHKISGTDSGFHAYTSNWEWDHGEPSGRSLFTWLTLVTFYQWFIAPCEFV